MALHRWLSNGSIYVSFEETLRRGDIDFKDYVSNQDPKSNKMSPKKSSTSKYLPSLKNLLPYRKSLSEKKVLPSNNAGLFSFVSLSWLSSTMWKAYRQGLTVEDLFDLQESDRAEGSARRLERLWCDEERQTGMNASLPLVVWRFVRTRSIVAMCLMVFAVIFQFVGPAWIQRLILDYVENPNQTLEWGFSLVAILFTCQILRNYCFGGSYVLGLHTGVRVQGALQFLIYKKMLLLHSGGEKALSQVITFCTNEQERIFEAVSMGVLILGTPVMFTMSVVYSCLILGPWALLGNVIILLFYPLMAVIASFTSHIRVQTVRITDQRVGLMSEILNNIRLIKMYAWEDSFTEKICQVRDDERRKLQKAAFLQSFSNTVTPAITLLASVSTFLGHSLSGHPLFATQAFTIFSVFTAMQFSVGTLPYGIKCLAEATVSLRKMQKFLQRPNHKSNVIKQSRDSSAEVEDMVVVREGSFAWDVPEEEYPTHSHSKNSKKGICKKHRGAIVKSKTKDNGESGNIFLGKDDEKDVPVAALQNISLTLKRGKLIGVCGSVGAGKSSLLSAIMGDMVIIGGRVEVNGSFAVVSQQAWIFNDTVQENILFGLPMDVNRYNNVLDVSCLNRDLKLLRSGDMTEIGERGTNLSGGQKQRISIARAVYAEKDIYLLDDPLSAVDARVARRIFECCIRGALREKTVLFATHSLQYLTECDEILFLKDGVISERGTHKELISIEGDYYQLTQFDETRKEEDAPGDKPSQTSVDVEKSPVREIKGEEPCGKMTAEEEHGMKRTGYHAFIRHAKYCGGYCVMSALLLLVMLFTLARLFSGIWLQIWLDHGDGLEESRKANQSYANVTHTEDELKGSINDNPYLWLFQTVYGLSFVAMMAIGLVKGVGIARQLLLGSSLLHDTMLKKVMRCPISFFDVTPPGRILQRFSRDMDELDVRVPFFFEFVWQGLMFVITQLVLVCFIFPVFSLVLFIATGLFAFMDVWLNKGLKESKKIDNFLKSPVLNHIASSMAGLSVIRAYGRHRVFLERFCARLNRTLASDFMFRSSVRWFTFRMDMVAVATVTLTGLIVVLLRSSVSSAEAGLALSCVFSVSTFVPYVMQLKSEMQARFTSVERVLEYAEELEEEENIVPSSQDKGTEVKDEEVVPPKGWPQNGVIEFSNVKLRHRPNLPLVLHGISAEIAGGEKVGVVGRTGAGKSSLLGALLRLIKLSDGCIKIDGIDISKVGLSRLRSTIAIIPQDPVLFHGTLRYNLDPFSEHSDEKIWEALEKAHLKEKITKEEKQLSMVVESDGENFSIGEKQLICLARALLRRNKILLLDEATASVDVETDSLIQNTVRVEFSSCTVVTIAHRLHTITSYDRVMVLEAGKVVEFDTPAALFSKHDSLFHRMMEAAGISTLG